MRSTWTLFALFGFPLNAFADAPVYDDSVIMSRMYIASSQSYQIVKQSCEVAGLFSHGNLVSKTIELTLEAKSQGAGFHCGQSLENNSLVVGIKGDIQQYTMDGVIVRFEELSTNYEPYLAFQLSPSFSLGVSQEIETGEYKTLSGNASSSSHRLLLSGTWHDGPWETTLTYADRYRDAINPGADVPRSLGFALRYAVSPLLTMGLIYTRIDYPGIASNGESAEMESNFLASIATRITPELKIELSYLKVSNGEGDDDAQSDIIGITGEYRLGNDLKVGAFLNQYKGTTDAFDITMTAYAFSLSMSR